jgi:hypothetical protein
MHVQRCPDAWGVLRIVQQLGGSPTKKPFNDAVSSQDVHVCPSVLRNAREAGIPTGPLHRGHMHTMWARSAGVSAETATLVWMQIYVADGGGHSLGHTDARQQDTVQLNA